MRLLRSVLAFGLLLLAAIPLVAGHSRDFHLTQDSARRLFLESPFAHGYMHGYEMGYHCGDLDVQMSHPPQDVKNEKHFKDGSKIYEREFGDKTSFVQGYQAGFRMGYADSYHGVDFRAVLALRQLSQDLPDIDPNAAPILDTAVYKGYFDGAKNGLEDGRANGDYRPDGADCELALRFKEAPAKFYCSVYSLGYRLGYADGFHNIRPEAIERNVAGEQ